MKILSDLRQEHGSVFVAELPDGTIVPWKPLSVGEARSYQEALDAELIAPAVLENEIWKKCVTDSVLVDSIYKQKAGTVTSIVKTILDYSLPRTLEEINFLLDQSRKNTDNIFDKIINLICQAFPIYTPEQLYAMDIFTLMTRLAQAERKCLDIGLWKEPLSFESASDKSPKRQKSKVDMNKLKEEYEKQNKKPVEPQSERSEKKERKPLDRSTKVEIEAEGTVDSRQKDFMVSSDVLVHNLDTDPTLDSPEEKQMLAEAKKLYKDYLAPLKKGQKVQIKPEEQRLEEAKKRSEINRKNLLKKRSK